MKRWGAIAGGVAGAVLCAGCATTPTAPSRPAAISHVVFFKLKSAADAPELLTDCDAKLPGIPGVVSYAAGRHLDIGRTNIDSDYDLGLYVGLADEAGYRAYLEHPLHTELVQKWRARWEWIRIYDVYDPTP
jgi:hypothetical protein